MRDHTEQDFDEIRIHAEHLDRGVAEDPDCPTCILIRELLHDSKIREYA
jgi:hypothetical protein